MTTEFKAVTPQRAVQIMRAWAYHPWPITFDEGTRIYTSLGFSGDPKQPRYFYSDLAETEADSSFIVREYGISSCKIRLSNWLPEEYWDHSRPRARVYYSDLVRVFCSMLGAPIFAKDDDVRSSSRWVTDKQVGVRLGGGATLVILTVDSPQRTRNFLDELEAEANGEEIGADYF